MLPDHRCVRLPKIHRASLQPTSLLGQLRPCACQGVPHEAFAVLPQLRQAGRPGPQVCAEAHLAGLELLGQSAAIVCLCLTKPLQLAEQLCSPRGPGSPDLLEASAEDLQVALHPRVGGLVGASDLHAQGRHLRGEAPRLCLEPPLQAAQLLVAHRQGLFQGCLSGRLVNRCSLSSGLSCGLCSSLCCGRGRSQGPVQARAPLGGLLLHELRQVQDTLEFTSELLHSGLPCRRLLRNQRRGLARQVLLRQLAHQRLGVAHLREATVDVAAGLGAVSCELLLRGTGCLRDAVSEAFKFGLPLRGPCLKQGPRLRSSVLDRRLHVRYLGIAAHGEVPDLRKLPAELGGHGLLGLSRALLCGEARAALLPKLPAKRLRNARAPVFGLPVRIQPTLHACPQLLDAAPCFVALPLAVLSLALQLRPQCLHLPAQRRLLLPRDLLEALLQLGQRQSEGRAQFLSPTPRLSPQLASQCLDVGVQGGVASLTGCPLP
mmetsp:Transcript_87842/g.243657  ORF Transcript_87842/g.243657 Transcript_87842/m.243657 type:complete len:489 (-) Transcript_87842:175-1641(-)